MLQRAIERGSPETGFFTESVGVRKYFRKKPGFFGQVRSPEKKTFPTPLTLL